jgi:hypothetical protein
MKRKSVIVLLTTILVGSLFALNKGETEIENNGWFRYTAAMPNFDFGNLTRSDFTLERGYIRLSHQWTNQLFSKMTVDVLSSPSYSDGASVRLKEAYIDYSLPLKDTKFTAGLQKDYFSLIYSWDYTNIEKSLADKEGVLASSDYGLTLNGYLPSGFGEWQLGAYNGEGYKVVYNASGISKVNTSPSLVANLRLTPIGGITFGSSVLYNKKDRSAYSNGSSFRSGDTLRFNPDTNNLNRVGIAPMVKVAVGPVSVLGEFITYGYTRDFSFYQMTKDSSGHVTDSTLNTKDKKYAMNGFSIVPVVSLLKKKLELVGRYDLWNVSAAGVKDTLKSHSMYGVGANWHFVRRGSKPGCELQVGWERQQPVATSVKPTDTFMVQFRLEWTGLITPQ